MSRLAAPLGLPLLLVALLSPAAYAGLTVEMSFDGSQVTIGSLLAQVCATSGVPLACDDALKDIALRVYGSGPAYRLLGSLEWITGGRWKLEQPGWLLVGPADRPSMVALLKRLTPEVADACIGSGAADRAWMLERIGEFARLVLDGEDGPVEWKWSTLTDEQRRPLTLLVLPLFVSTVRDRLSRPADYSCRGPLCDGCRVAWLPEPDGFEKVQLTSADGRSLTWTADGAFTPEPGAEPIGAFLADPISLKVVDASLDEVLARLCPPMSFVLSTMPPSEKRGTVDLQDKGFLEVLAQVGKTWSMDCQVEPALRTLAVGQMPSSKLVPAMAAGSEQTMASLEGYLDEVRAALVQEGPPETRSWASLSLPQFQGWFARILRGLAEHLTTSQRVMLRDQGSLPVESLSAEQRKWLLTAMDVQSGVMAWGHLPKAAPHTDFPRLSGEVSRERLIMEHPDLLRPVALRVPQE